MHNNVPPAAAITGYLSLAQPTGGGKAITLSGPGAPVAGVKVGLLAQNSPDPPSFKETQAQPSWTADCPASKWIATLIAGEVRHPIECIPCWQALHLHCSCPKLQGGRPPQHHLSIHHSSQVRCLLWASTIAPPLRDSMRHAYQAAAPSIYRTCVELSASLQSSLCPWH